MKTVIFTSNALRHVYFANTLSEHIDDVLVIVECKKLDVYQETEKIYSPIQKHFYERSRSEKIYFGGNQSFTRSVVPIIHGELNSAEVYNTVKEFRPDVGFVFGSSIIREPLLSLIPSGRFINMHLGLSPYYRGSGTNFWPFINGELEYIGATLLHLDSGVDTGDIIAHTRPVIEHKDTVHSTGCKTIVASTNTAIKILEMLYKNIKLNRTPQWKSVPSYYYRKRDFTDKAVEDYLLKIRNGVVEKFITNKDRVEPRLIDFLSP